MRGLSRAVLTVCATWALMGSVWAAGDDSAGYPEPRVNPLGDLAAYRSVKFESAATRSFPLPNAQGGFDSTEMAGEVWVLEMEYRGTPAQTREWLANYAGTLGAAIISERSGDEFLARFDPEPTSRWWLYASDQRDGYRVTVAHTRHLEPGSVVSLEMGGARSRGAYFYTESRSGMFETLEVAAPAGDFSLHAESREGRGEFRRDYRYKRRLQQQGPFLYRLSDIALDPGLYRWHLEYRGQAPVTVEVRRRAGDPLEKVPLDPRLGGIRISNVSNSRVSAEPDGDTKIIHPEIESVQVRADYTPGGDAVMLVPPGYWKISVVPPESNVVERVEALSIPVRPGEETQVRWPSYLTRAFGQARSGGLEIASAEVGPEKGTLILNLVGDSGARFDLSRATIEVFEGEQTGRVLSLSTLEIPPDVVLLLDSSGSMKGSMEQALDATRAFVDSLPETTRIRVVDFDTAPKLLAGETRAQVLESLAGVRADGATALYDSVLAGLDMLSDSKRPALVLFTDGVDANYNDTGPGSQATREQLFAAASEATVPVFTIGFGGKHDRDALERLASLSGGLYFSADNPEALAATFSAVRDSVVNAYELKYQRPERVAVSDVPVVQLVVDVSGSMAESVPDATAVQRLDSVREILIDFIDGLPPDTLVSIQSFSDLTRIVQVATAEKPRLRRALSLLRPDSGTKVAVATRAALESLRAIPSTRRYLVFITDAAIQVKSDEAKQFDTALAQLRDERIQSLWLGVGVDGNDTKVKQGFDHAAEGSGGRALVSSDPLEIAEVFTALAGSVVAEDRPSTSRTTIRVAATQRESNGALLSFTDAKMSDAPSAPISSERSVPRTLDYAFAPLPPRYDTVVAGTISGGSMPAEETVITQRIPLGVEASNSAFTVNAGEIVFLNRLKGLDPPRGQRILAVSLVMANRLPEQEVTVYPDGSSHPSAWMAGGAASQGRVERRVPDYLVPDLQRHLYLRLNNQQVLPVSNVTWLAEAPLILPGENSVRVRPLELTEGSVLFLVPEAPVEQLSLHFYDTRYGHVDLALIGEYTAGVSVTDLPTGPPVQLSDAFALGLKAVTDQPAIDELEATAGSTFRVLDLGLRSQVQALLSIDPFERFSLRLPTGLGSVQLRLHEATALLPLGFYRSSLMTPGAEAPIRLAFQVPAGLAERTAGQLVVDVKGGGVTLPLGPSVIEDPAPSNAIPGDGIALVVNGAGAVDSIGGQKGRWRVVDVTLVDAQDSEATRLGGIFHLVRDDANGQSSRMATPTEMENRKKGLGGFSSNNSPLVQLRVPTDPEVSRLLAGLSASAVVPDGRERRGLLVFRLPVQDDSGHEWLLRSTVFPELDHVVTDAAYADKSMLAEAVPLPPTLRGEEEKAFKAALLRAVAEHRASGKPKPGHYDSGQVDLDGQAEPSAVLPPDLVTLGSQRLERLQSEDAILETLRSLRWIPAARKPWDYLMSPEAVLTQGWGTQDDLARLAEVALARQGVLSRRTGIELNDSGRQALAQKAGLEAVTLKDLPVLRIATRDGGERTLVLPFYQSVEELAGYLGKEESQAGYAKSPTVSFQLVAETVPATADRVATTSKIAGALAGGSGEIKPREVTLLQAELDREALSRGPVDIAYFEGVDGDGPFHGVRLSYRGGTITGERGVHLNEEAIVGLKIRARPRYQWLEHTTRLGDGEQATGVFHTLGLNLPDLPEDALARIDQDRERVARVERTDDYSALRFYTHGVLARFLAAQTRAERSLAADSGLVIGRTERPRVLVVTTSRHSDSARLLATLDLVQSHTDVQAGAADQVRAFNFLSGILEADLERSALSEFGTGLMSLWRDAPPENRLLTVSDGNRKAVVDIMKQTGYPEDLVEYLARSRKIALFPTHPTVVAGRARWGWLEIDAKTNEAVAVLDDGTRGAMLEYSVNDWFVEAQMGVVGFFHGTSTSVWSVALYSLEIEDYEEIVKRARKLAMVTAKRVCSAKSMSESGAKAAGSVLDDGDPGDLFGLVDIGKEFESAGDAPEEKSGGAGSRMGPKLGFGWQDSQGLWDDGKVKVTLGADLIDFCEGFELGVESYFAN